MSRNREAESLSSVELRNRRLMGKFFTIVFSIVGTFLLVFAAFAFGLFGYTNEGGFELFTGGGLIGNSSGGNASGGNNSIFNMFSTPVKTTFLIAGVDKEAGLTDTMLAGSFDRETNGISLVSLPRDTYITLSDATVAEIVADGGKAPKSRIMKLNSVYKRGKAGNGMKYLEMELEQVLGVKFDYYFLVDLDAFKKIVTAIGGVRMDIRPEGYKYFDPNQNLVINVPGGKDVMLDGDMAEGVVRYRHDYRGGDLQRIEIQHEFLKQLVTQLLQKDTLMKNAVSLFTTIISYVKTDFNVADLPKYVSYIDNISSENLKLYTLPGVPETIRQDGEDVSYFILDKENLDDFITDIFFKTKKEIDAEQSKTVDIKSKKIQVLNGGGGAGSAGRYQEKLIADGYNVPEIGNFTGTLKEETRILVREAGNYDELKGYFSNAVVSVSKTMDKNYDIVIIIGKGEK